MSIQMSSVPSVKPATLSALNEAAQAGLEFASAASGLEALLMKNQRTAANQLPPSPAPAPAPPTTTGPATGTQQGGPLGGILQQLMQLLQMLVPVMQQLGGGAGPQANGPACNVAKHMPGGGAGGPLGGGAMGGGAPGAGGAMGAGAPTGGAAMPGAQMGGMVAVPVMMLVPANSPLAGGIGAGAPMGAGAPAAAAPAAAQPAATGGAQQPFFGSLGIGITTHEQGLQWARGIRPDATADELNQGAILAGIFSSGRAL
jgi:hypothetical protein